MGRTDNLAVLVGLLIYIKLGIHQLSHPLPLLLHPLILNHTSLLLLLSGPWREPLLHTSLRLLHLLLPGPMGGAAAAAVPLPLRRLAAQTSASTSLRRLRPRRARQKGD